MSEPVGSDVLTDLQRQRLADYALSQQIDRIVTNPRLPVLPPGDFDDYNRKVNPPIWSSPPRVVVRVSAPPRSRVRARAHPRSHTRPRSIRVRQSMERWQPNWLPFIIWTLWRDYRKMIYTVIAIYILCKLVH